MAEYIEREALKQSVRMIPRTPHPELLFHSSVQKVISNAPTADVVEVRHGEWNIKSEIHQMLDDVDEELYVECPFCKRTFYVPYEFEDEKILKYARENYPYCHCGAKMDGKEGAG